MQLEAANAIDRVLAPVTPEQPQPTTPPTSPTPENVINFAERLAARRKETYCA